MTVLEPSEPDLFVKVRNDLETLLANSFTRTRRHLLAINIPLGLEQRLNDVFRSRANRQHSLGVFDVAEEPELFELLEHGLASVEALHTSELATIARDETLIVDYGDKLEVVSLAALEIVCVVRRSDLDGARTELRVDHFIGDDLDLARGDERVLDVLADELLVAVVFRIDGNGCVA